MPKHMLTKSDFQQIDDLIVKRVTEIVSVVLEEALRPIKKDIALLKKDLRSFQHYVQEQNQIMKKRVEFLEQENENMQLQKRP